jgi:hypothetical protein
MANATKSESGDKTSVRLTDADRKFALKLLNLVPDFTERSKRARRGPRSHFSQISTIVRTLRAEGRVYVTKKAEWRAVLEGAGVPDTTRGWGYGTFVRVRRLLAADC